MRHSSKALSMGLGAAALCAVAAHASSRTPVFRSDIDLVNVAVTITDRESRYVTGLAENDFQILEDGVPQDLKLFTRERLPLSLAVLLDTSQSMTVKLAEAQQAATRLVRTLISGDEAQVIQFNERARIVQDFTSDQSALETAIKSTRANGSTGLYNAIYIALKDLNTRKRMDQVRRMAMVVLSDGQDTTSLISDDQVLALARTSGIAVYGISLRPALPRPLTLGEDGIPRYFFAALGRETGGQAHFLNGVTQLGGIYDQVAEELRSQYNLGYVSTNAAHDGRWRQIQVRLRGQPYAVRHKMGYYAPRSR
jgi:Ca-activated chloride channel family protein